MKKINLPSPYINVAGGANALVFLAMSAVLWLTVLANVTPLL